MHFFFDLFVAGSQRLALARSPDLAGAQLQLVLDPSAELQRTWFVSHKGRWNVGINAERLLAPCQDDEVLLTVDWVHCSFPRSLMM